jgi:hypothetical protein
MSYRISFAGCDDTIKRIMGEQPLSPSEMTKPCGPT